MMNWALGIPGIKPLLIVAAVALVLYGRTGHRLLGMTRYGRVLQPLLNHVPRRSWQRLLLPEDPLQRRRLYWALVITLTIALAALLATRVAIHNSVGASH